LQAEDQHLSSEMCVGLALSNWDLCRVPAGVDRRSMSTNFGFTIPWGIHPLLLIQKRIS
jgi:hypothetical protein